MPRSLNQSTSFDRHRWNSDSTPPGFYPCQLSYGVVDDGFRQYVIIQTWMTPRLIPLENSGIGANERVHTYIPRVKSENLRDATSVDASLGQANPTGLHSRPPHEAPTGGKFGTICVLSRVSVFGIFTKRGCIHGESGCQVRSICMYRYTPRISLPERRNRKKEKQWKTRPGNANGNIYEKRKK